MNKTLLSLLVFILVTPSTGALGTNEEVLTIAGTGDNQSLLRTLGDAYQQSPKGRNIIVLVPDSIGSSGGIRAVVADKVSLARTARPLKDKEKKLGLLEFHFALSPIVFVVHPSVDGIQNLTSEQINGIYTGKFRHWQEVGGPARPIYPIDREIGDSSRTVLEQRLSAFPNRKSVGKIYYTTATTATALSEHKFTIGYLPLSIAKSYGLKVLTIDGIAPSEKNILNGQYKYVTPFNIASKGPPVNHAKHFVDFLFTEHAKRLIRATGSIPVN